MKLKFLAKLVLPCLFLGLMMACSRRGSEAEVQRVNELNRRAYTYMYKDLAQAEAWVKVLHEIPEHSFCEYKTTAFIRTVCQELGVETIDSGLETGVLAWLDLIKIYA